MLSFITLVGGTTFLLLERAKERGVKGMRSEEIRIGMWVVVGGSDRPFDGQVGQVTATFGHPSFLALDLRFDDGRLELFWAKDVSLHDAQSRRFQKRLDNVP